MNEKLIKNLEILRNFYQRVGDRWRTSAYDKAIYAIKQLDFEITTISQVKNIKGIGKSISQSIDEFLTIGKINKITDIEAEQNIREDSSVNKKDIIEQFTNIWGIGTVKATDLYNRGCRSIQDVRDNLNTLNLTSQQLVGLQYYEELLQPLTREFITIFSVAIRYILYKKYGKEGYKMTVAGSYRRQQKTSGDMDILITSTKFTLTQLVSLLQEWKLVTDVLSMRDEKFMGIACCANSKGHHFRIDIEFINEDEWYPALVYFTGSKINNIIMRNTAKKLGLTLNQHGLFNSTGEKIIVNSEEDIYSLLNLTYAPPNKR